MPTGIPSYTVEALGHVWDGSAWVPAPSSGGGGGGDASAANQVTGNASLASIDDKLTGPVPVSLASVPSHAVTGPLTDTQLRASAVPVSGTVTASGPLTDAQLRAAAVLVADTRPATSSVTSVNASAVSVTIAAANAARRGLLVFNDADKSLYLKLGATASATSYSVRIAAGGYYEVPNPSYSGIVDGIWEAAPTGAARVTELS